VGVVEQVIEAVRGRRLVRDDRGDRADAQEDRRGGTREVPSSRAGCYQGVLSIEERGGGGRRHSRRSRSGG
jgi:hypothetical protein